MKRKYITPKIIAQTITPIQIIPLSGGTYGIQYTQEDFDLEEEEEESIWKWKRFKLWFKFRQTIYNRFMSDFKSLQNNRDKSHKKFLDNIY